MLFVIGLELQPSRLWVLRKQVFGLGSSQVLLTGLVLGTIGYMLGLPVNAALIVGIGLALSSTAFVLQMHAEQKQLTTVHGRAAFSLLLLQDLAVIPLLALVPFLGVIEAATAQDSAWMRVLQIVSALVAIVVGGRYLLRPVFRALARWGSEDTFTAAALLIVVGAALLMNWVELSMGLGAFLAGLLVADSEYRHQLEADITPFKGLLIGLFFIAVGMSVDVGLLISQLGTVIQLTLGLLLIKGIILFGLGHAFSLSNTPARNLAFTICQGGEFAFVLFGVAVGSQIIDQTLADLLIVVVTLSMGLTPFLF